jgi:hypothetical protein
VLGAIAQFEKASLVAKGIASGLGKANAKAGGHIGS